MQSKAARACAAPSVCMWLSTCACFVLVRMPARSFPSLGLKTLTHMDTQKQPHEHAHARKRTPSPSPSPTHPPAHPSCTLAFRSSWGSNPPATSTPALVDSLPGAPPPPHHRADPPLVWRRGRKLPCRARSLAHTHSPTRANTYTRTCDYVQIFRHAHPHAYTAPRHPIPPLRARRLWWTLCPEPLLLLPVILLLHPCVGGEAENCHVVTRSLAHTHKPARTNTYTQVHVNMHRHTDMHTLTRASNPPATSTPALVDSARAPPPPPHHLAAPRPCWRRDGRDTLTHTHTHTHTRCAHARSKDNGRRYKFTPRKLYRDTHTHPSARLPTHAAPRHSVPSLRAHDLYLLLLLPVILLLHSGANSETEDCHVVRDRHPGGQLRCAL